MSATIAVNAASSERSSIAVSCSLDREHNYGERNDGERNDGERNDGERNDERNAVVSAIDMQSPGIE